MGTHQTHKPKPSCNQPTNGRIYLAPRRSGVVPGAARKTKILPNLAATAAETAAAVTLIGSQGAERCAAPERSPDTAAAHIAFHPAQKRQAGAQFDASPSFAQGARCVRKHAKWLARHSRESIRPIRTSSRCSRTVRGNVEDSSSLLLEGTCVLLGLYSMCMCV